MASLEEIMAGLFGDVEARGAQGLGGRTVRGVDDRDPRRRRAGLDSGFGGIAGGEVTLASILPHLQGLRTYDYSGPNIRGLADLLPALQNFEGLAGPSRRHLQNQVGPDFGLPPGLSDNPELPPGVDNRNAPGGPNVAPGNVDNGLALGQAPGIPPQAMGNARGQQMHNQGWRNVAPGFSAAASLGYGTPEFEQRLGAMGFGGRPGAIAGGPEAAQVRPGAFGGVSAGGGGQGKGVGGGGGGPTPVKAGGPAEVAPKAGGASQAGVGKPGAGPGPGPGAIPTAQKARGEGKRPGAKPGKIGGGGGGTGADTAKKTGGAGPKGGGGGGKPVNASSGTSADTAKKGPAGKTAPKPAPAPSSGGSSGTSADTAKKVAPGPAPAPKPSPKPAPGPGSTKPAPALKKQQL